MWWVYGAGIYLFGIALFFLFKHISEFDVVDEYFPCKTRTESILHVLNLIRNIMGLVLFAWVIGYLFAMAMVVGLSVLVLSWISGFDL